MLSNPRYDLAWPGVAFVAERLTYGPDPHDLARTLEKLRSRKGETRFALTVDQTSETMGGAGGIGGARLKSRN